jgi:hypothetical protein|tara:strand:+ start:143 stop:910 length:768 start_codon:yes stop_codon:yes gene_type:complete
MKSNTIKKKEHFVYEHISEFYKDHPDITPVEDWRDGKEGDWVWSDDGNILQLLKVNSISHPKDSKNYKYAKGYVRTVVGTFIIDSKNFMDSDFTRHPNRYTFSRTITNPNKRVKERKSVTNKEKLFATNVAVGMGAVKAYMDAYEEDSPDKAKRKAVVLLKQERVMKEVERGVQDIAKSLGINHEYILNNLKVLAETSADENIALQSLKELGKAIGTLGTGVKKIEQGIVGMFQGFSPEQIEKAERKILSSGKEV